MEHLEIKIDRMKHLDSSINLIEGIYFSAKKGEIISLLGPSGAGKTTLLRIISGLENNYEGTILLEEKKILKPSRAIQLVFQDNRLFPWMTVKQNLLFSLKNRDREEINKWLNKLEMKNNENAYIKNLSGGEEARISFARVFMDTPKVLLLDEPFRNLDIKMKDKVINELNSFHQENKNMIIIIVSHSIEDAVYISDRIILLSSRPMKITSIYANNEFKNKISSDPLVYQHIEKIRDKVLNS